jgi:LysM repeat protein
MQSNFNRTLLVASTLISLHTVGFAQTQNQPYYKDVLLDGKPARLNVATGEFQIYDAKTQTYIYQKPEVTETAKADTSITPEEVNPDVIYHVVKKGESLVSISKTYNVLINSLKAYNKLETTLVAVGQRLRISAPTPSEMVWTVSKGETLFKIAKKNKMRVSKLKRLNGLRSNTIIVGQQLKLQ